ncbi:MAG: hypothetical protein CM1200mP34_1030 [Verrucomicrobiales bacterium]|nr:MAG: hypothetical protein CM1200mP34_1030 [Verrucomicrobiales bacterium]
MKLALPESSQAKATPAPAVSNHLVVTVAKEVPYIYWAAKRWGPSARSRVEIGGRSQPRAGAFHPGRHRRAVWDDHQGDGRSQGGGHHVRKAYTREAKDNDRHPSPRQSAPVVGHRLAELGTRTRRWPTWAQGVGEHREHHEVLHLEWHTHARNKEWERCAAIGGVMASATPTTPPGGSTRPSAVLSQARPGGIRPAEPVRLQFPKNEAIPYNLACYACQFGDSTWRWTGFRRRKKWATRRKSGGGADGSRHGADLGPDQRVSGERD